MRCRHHLRTKPLGLGGETLTTTKIPRFCISHKEPLLPGSWYDYCISLGDYQSDSPYHVSQLNKYWHDARPIAYGAAGSYVLRIAFERSANSAELIEISTYRKRILSCPEGVESQSHPTMRELSFGEARMKHEVSICAPAAGLQFLIAQPLYFETSIIEQYASCHPRRDILDYTSIAIELGVLDKESAEQFLTAKSMVPGAGDLGIYPRPYLVRSLEIIETVGREYLERHGGRVRKYDAYQVRSVGYLHERLGSFLLLRHLTEIYPGGIPAEIFGHMTAIVEDGTIYARGTADTQRRWSNLLRLKGSRPR